MLNYVPLAVFCICFTAINLLAQNLTEDPNANLIFPNFSIQALDESNYRAFPGQQTEKMFVVIAYATVNWFRAQEICGYQGLSLATINSREESRALQAYLTRAGLNLNREAFWLAGSIHADNKNWVWFSTGRPLTYA
ncbi:PREDICTED: uncharacterized protein LOC108354881, partial [Rhagoletis zephyria]|uniref:uncharacterized protein LOC108354881 n=1 Tax=Rhagoletis zephyria TaxID=28612 RepID=UPI000811944A